MWTLYHKVQFFFQRLRKQLAAWLLRLGCHFFSSWHYLNIDSICTTGKVLKINKVYTYKESGYVDIVRLTDVHVERGYLYCSLFFFSKNKIITVCQTLKKNQYALWRLMDNEEYDEIMSRRLRHQIEKQDELLDFRF